MVDSSDIKANLLTYLQSETEKRGITYAVQPTPITGGFDTSIYKFTLRGASPELSRPLVLRIFTRDPGMDRAPFESIIQNTLAGLGYPVPRVHLTSTNGEFFGGSFMIMEFLNGHPMVDEPEDTIPKMLAKAHLDLHAIDTIPILNNLRDNGIKSEHVSFDHRFNSVKNRIERDGHEWLQTALDWIVEHRPEEPDRLAVIHGDFHPLNILVADSKVRGVLDWSGFMIGDPALDVAITRFLGMLAFPYYLTHIDWFSLIKQYTGHYNSESPIDSERVGFYETFRNLTSLLEGVEGHRGWGHPETMVRLSKNLEEKTGIKVDKPDYVSK